MSAPTTVLPVPDASPEAATWRSAISRAYYVEPARSQITDAMKIYERDVRHDVTGHP